MRKLFTPDDVVNIQYFKMPKFLLRDPKYMPMRCESKMAYMLMLDLLPLSIQNKWVNENNEVYVKLSRQSLMELLNIKGTQKAAQVMKELVDFGLIINKRVGLTRCNEIYIYHIEDLEATKEKKVEKPKPSKENNLKDLEDMAEINRILNEQIHLEDLKLRYEPDLVNEIAYNIKEMFLNKTTFIGRENKPAIIIRGVISKLKMQHIEYVIEQFSKASLTREIYKPKAYIQTLIYNSIYETEIKTINNIQYNFGYC